MEHAVVISGFGGQGLLFAGQVLAHAAMIEGLEVLWIPSYGPEMRGGAAACTVILGDEPIGSPVVDRANIVIALTRPSFDKYASLVEGGGLVVVDGSLVAAEPPPDVELASLPCTRLARDAGDDRLVSVVALGAALARRPILALGTLRTALERVVGAKHPELLAADLVALDSGIGAVSAA